jgi:CBS domain containing-hemolysin-like protein
VAKLHEWFLGQRAWSITVFAVVVFLFYALFDLLPKMLFRAYPNQLCLSAANPFRPIHFVLGPLVVIVEDVSKLVLRWTGGRALTGRLFGNREEMLAVMQESAQALTNDERAMINRVLDLQTFTVRQIATPLAQTVTIETQTPIADVLVLARERKLSRLPVREMRDGRPRIAGLLMLGPLLFRDDLDLQKPAAAHMTPALFLGEDTRLEVALRRMQRAGERLAIVLARDGSELGVVSLEDIFKLMFGEVKL